MSLKGKTGAASNIVSAVYHGERAFGGYTCPDCGAIIADIQWVRQQHRDRWCKHGKIKIKSRSSKDSGRGYMHTYWFQGALHRTNARVIAEKLGMTEGCIKGKLDSGYTASLIIKEALLRKGIQEIKEEVIRLNGT